MEDSFAKLRGGAGKLSVSHDSVFPGEVPHTRPLSSLASLATLEVGTRHGSLLLRDTRSEKKNIYIYILRDTRSEKKNI